MSDSDKELKISIVTQADTSGVTKASDAVADLGKAAAITGANQYDLGEDLAKVEKRIEGVSGQSREMYRIFYELDRVVPGLGEGLRGMVTGPLGVMGALLFGLYQAKQAWDEYDKALEAVLGEDMESGIDKATALATAFNGIADAIQKANDNWNSPESIASRAPKHLSDQAALGNKVTEATNARIQAQNDATKAAGFHLPASDEEAKANAAALGKSADTRRAQGESERAEAARIQDAIVQGNTTPLGLGTLMTAGFWDFARKQLVRHGLAVWNYEAGIDAAREASGTGASDLDIANSMDAGSARMGEQIKARDAARSKAATSAGAATRAQLEAGWEGNPNNSGSLAQKIQGDNALAANIKRIQADLAVHGPGAQKAMQDAVTTLASAVETFKALSDLGANVLGFKQQLDDLRHQVRAVQATGNR